VSPLRPQRRVSACRVLRVPPDRLTRHPDVVDVVDVVPAITKERGRHDVAVSTLYPRLSFHRVTRLAHAITNRERYYARVKGARSRVNAFLALAKQLRRERKRGAVFILAVRATARDRDSVRSALHCVGTRSLAMTSRASPLPCRPAVMCRRHPACSRFFSQFYPYTMPYTNTTDSSVRQLENLFPNGHLRFPYKLIAVNKMLTRLR